MSSAAIDLPTLEIIESETSDNEQALTSNKSPHEEGHLFDVNLRSHADSDIVLSTASSLIAAKRKRSSHTRPEDWRIIAEHYDLWGKKKTCELYKDHLSDLSKRSVSQTLKKWSKDLQENKGRLTGKRAPAYGFPIDLLLLREVEERIELRLPVDDVTLHSLLVHQLEVHGKLELMSGNGGSHLFLHGWAGRFWYEKVTKLVVCNE